MTREERRGEGGGWKGPPLAKTQTSLLCAHSERRRAAPLRRPIFHLQLHSLRFAIDGVARKESRFQSDRAGRQIWQICVVKNVGEPMGEFCCIVVVLEEVREDVGELDGNKRRFWCTGLEVFMHDVMVVFSTMSSTFRRGKEGREAHGTKPKLANRLHLTL